jgi:hypothetical protein
MITPSTKTLTFTTVKQVKEAIRAQRQLLIDKYTNGQGRLPAIYAESMDGNHGRIYHLCIAVANPDGTYAFVRPFEEFTDWVQGGLPKSELLDWANATFI